MLNAASFDPFAQVLFLPAGIANPNVREYSTRRYLEGLGLRALVEERGLAEAWHIVSESSGGNAPRIFERLSDFIPPTHFDFQPFDLFALHKESVKGQMSSSVLACERSAWREEAGSCVDLDYQVFN